ncbi:MAG: sigma-70 family RNA polymerase sigma factor [Sarcina sp.]
MDNDIDELKLGNLNVLEKVIDNYSSLVFKVSYSILNNRELSNECVNETFFKVWSNIKCFNKDEKSFKNWICTIAKYTAIDILRKEKRHNNKISIDDVLTEVTAKEIDMENKIVIENIINQFNDKDKRIFIRRFYKNQEISKIAKDLNMSENAIYLRISRAKKILLKKLR